jgi:hypothetical protein
MHCASGTAAELPALLLQSSDIKLTIRQPNIELQSSGNIVGVSVVIDNGFLEQDEV